MKLEEDFEAMFTITDTKNKGYLTPDEVSGFYQTLFGHDINADIASAVIKKVCSSAQCTSQHFQDVLVMLEEWRIKEENAYWDFKTLDRLGQNVIPLSGGLFLAKSVKKNDFSIDEWNAWKNLRLKNASVLSWSDFKDFMYFDGGKYENRKTNDAEFEKMYNSLMNEELDAAVDDYRFFKASLESDETVSAELLKEKQRYHEDVHNEASRLVNRWNIGGVEAVIHDDGMEWDAAEDQISKDDVTLGEILSAMDEKYDVLRNKLIWEMVRQQIGDDNPGLKLTQARIEEEVMTVKNKESYLRKSGALGSEFKTLYGSDVIRGRDLLALMGDVTGSNWAEAKAKYETYKKEGKEAQDINRIYEEEILEKMKNSKVSSGEMLVELWKRQKEEKQNILAQLKAAKDTSQRLVLFTALYRQCERAKEGSSFLSDASYSFGFEPSVANVGVAERKQVFDPSSSSEDSIRQEIVARARLHVSKLRRKSTEAPVVGDRLKDVSQVKNLGNVDSWIEVAKLLEKKHDAEREMLVHFLQNMTHVEKNLQKMKPEEQEDRRSSLKEMFGDWKGKLQHGIAKDEKVSQRPYQLALLHEGVALYKENLKRNFNHRPANELPGVILAQLQILQDVQYQEIQEQLRQMDSNDVYKLRKFEYRAIRDEHFDNIASLIFTSKKISENEIKLYEVILRKYDLLREKLFVDQVRRYWSNEDEEKILNDLREDEKKGRGNRENLKELCKRLHISYSAHEILGPLYSRFSSAFEVNKNAEKVVSVDEMSLLSGDEADIFSELERRYKDECAVLGAQLRGSGNEDVCLQELIEDQLWSLAVLEGDKCFLSSALNLGLLERTKLAKNKIRLKEDTQRYVRCAQERFPLPEPFNEQSIKSFVSENKDATTALQSVLSLHFQEWEKLRLLLKDDTAEELREAASLMTSDERVKRLAEINSKRKTIDLKQTDGKDDLLFLLEEAAALKIVSRKEILRTLIGEEGATNEDVFVSLLADLHQEQNSDKLHWFGQVSPKSGTTDVREAIDQHMDQCENIFRVLCKYESLVDDENLLQALEDKYDLLRDKLLSEALMRQIGEEEWRRMSEKERQRRLMQLKLEERRLRREGRLDELAKLLGDAFANDTRMKQLLGESREEYEKRLRERLAARKRGEVLPEEDGEELDVKNGKHNPLLDLALKLDEERDALLRMLGNQDDRFLSEKERQAALLRLRQAQLRAAGEERYEAAMLVSGLADREAAAQERLKSDRMRQRELARRRMEELKKKSHALPVVTEEEKMIVRDGERHEMIEAVIKKLHLHQAWERAWITSLLHDVSDPFPLTTTMSSQQVVDKLQACEAKMPDGIVVLDDYRPLLSDAALYRQVILARHVTPITDQSRDEVKVTVLSDLQETQDKESKVLTDKMASMTQADLVQEQEKLISYIQTGSSTSVPRTLFITSSGADPQEQLLDALDGKYRAVIDSLVAKVLPDKVGKSNWDSMSPEEKETKISDLSSQVRELMDAGRYDDALDLLTEGLTEEKRQEIIDILFGDEDERKKYNLREREKKMNDRIKNGMSPEEAKRLFEEEGLLFEEQEKKRRRNVLEGLAIDLDAEKNALLKALQDAKNKEEEERKRQALLAKLRLQERLLRRENNLSTMAKMLAMSLSRDDAIEKERQRQFKIAQERLEERRRKKALGLEDEKNEPIDLRLDSDDVVTLADAVMREMEAKHAAERNALMEFMDSACPETDLRKEAERRSALECKNRIRTLREMRRQWRNEDPRTLEETKEEHWKMLNEAVALQLTSLISTNSLKEDECQAHLLSDLQAEQKKETTYLLAGLLAKNPVTVRKMAEVQREARVGCWYDNIANSLLGDSSQKDVKEGEEEVVRALEEKYDALKDKLLAEALLKKLGEKEWAKLSEKERQRRIMQVKQREKKLRREGKMDELASLFHALAITEQDIERIFGSQRESQKEALMKRRERIRELRKEKKQQGLPIDDDEILKQVNAEEKEEKQKRLNILLTLDQNLDAERDALLANLRKHEDSITEERRRQLAVAKLRRQRRQVEAEEKLSAIDYVFQTAKQDEEAVQARLAEDRQRHTALAMERLAARKTQKQRKEAFAALTNSDQIYEKLKMIAAEKNEGSSTEQLLYEMEKKHFDEKDTLTLLLLAAEYDDSKQQEVHKMDQEKIERKLEKFYKNRKGWREERMMRAIAESGDEPLTDKQRKALSQYVADQNKVLISALRYKLEAACRESLEEGNVTSLKNKISGEWLTELKHTQDNELKTTTDLIADKDDEILNLLTQDQKRARREKWIDNIGKVVFGLALPGQDQSRPASSSSSLDQEVQEMEANAKEKMEEIEKELMEEKAKIQRKKIEGEPIDSKSALAELEKQFSDRKAALTSDLERQRQHMRKRLRERRQLKDETEYEVHAAMGMVLLAEQRLKAKENRSQANASKQRNLMQERLAARREKRRLEQQPNVENEQRSLEEGASPDKKPTPPPFSPMMREKTVINVKVTDKDKNEMLEQLHNLTKNFREKLEKEKEEQQKIVERKRAQMRERKVKAADELLTLHEREKTIIQETKAKSLERQKTMLSDRLSKLKYDRTMTMKMTQKKRAQNFAGIMDDKDVADKNEKMEKVAEELQKKLKEGKLPDEKEDNAAPDEGTSNDAETSLPLAADLDVPIPPRPQTASRRLDQQEKDRILKKRMREKTKIRREKIQDDIVGEENS